LRFEGLLLQHSKNGRASESSGAAPLIQITNYQSLSEKYCDLESAFVTVLIVPGDSPSIFKGFAFFRKIEFTDE
jgi:hypothetical protein